MFIIKELLKHFYGGMERIDWECLCLLICIFLLWKKLI